ncbi:phosphotransferase [Salmonella enterica subsp. enterica serovar Senftenberg]|nr:phosphotransferase [Salmonella enterica subsp. enterica serovar Senftenberg]EEO0096439.1 phosphotransferase [Salmonella enterica subsp. enterica serovar Senftenberg]EKD2966397.1 macrolide 2'-phosphotransferase [Salmonella enterica]MBZ3868847.1 macrolide 2'-phosphotransferase [Salmonella enterica subsp. enterica serovar 4,[5],12:i:-]
MKNNDIQTLAERHGLQITNDICFNEMGIDFSVGFATDVQGRKWVLRIPRRPDMTEQIQREQNILRLAQEHLSIAVPDWQVVSDELIAYPLLPDPPALTFDAKTYEVTWNMDMQAPRYVESLAKVLVELHRIPVDELTQKGIKSLTIVEARQELLEQIKLVKQELGIAASLEKRWLHWVDNDLFWPDFTSFVHGDLYAGHVLVAPEATVTGIIDWSEGQGNDPAMDFAGHIAAFGEDSLKKLITAYEQSGGTVWDKLFEQAVERHSASALRYAVFAIHTKDKTHLQAVKAQLGIS